MTYLRYRSYRITPDRTEYTESNYPRGETKTEYYGKEGDFPRPTKRLEETYEIDFTDGLPGDLANTGIEFLHYDLPRSFDVDDGVIQLIRGNSSGPNGDWRWFTDEELRGQMQRFCQLMGFAKVVEYRKWEHCCEDSYKGTSYTFPVGGISSTQIDGFYSYDQHVDSITCCRAAGADGPKDIQLRDFKRWLEGR